MNEVESCVRVVCTIDKCATWPAISYATLWVWQRSGSLEIRQKFWAKNQLKLEIQQQVTDFGLVRDIYQFYSQSARALIKVHADANRKPNGPMTSIELTDCEGDLACSTKGQQFWRITEHLNWSNTSDALQLIAFALRVVPLICHPESRVSCSLKGAKGGDVDELRLGSHVVHDGFDSQTHFQSTPKPCDILGYWYWLIALNANHVHDRQYTCRAFWLNFDTIRWPGWLDFEMVVEPRKTKWPIEMQWKSSWRKETQMQNKMLNKCSPRR